MKKIFLICTLALGLSVINTTAKASDGDVVAAAVKAGENMKSLCKGGQSAITQKATDYAMTLLTTGKISDPRGAIIDATKSLMAICMGGH